MKKLSIITINYNDVDGLESTIKSVLTQTFKDYQYIVIDGNSNDGSKEILNKYKDSIDVAISEPDKGIYNAMNKGASYASGEYLLFLNSGDTLFDNSVLERLFKIPFNEDIVSSRVFNYSLKDAYIKIPPEKISLFTFTGGSLPHPSSLIKRSLFFMVGGYIEDYKIISDWCFFIDSTIKHNCSYRVTPIILAKFNRFGISSNNSSIAQKESIDFLDKKYGRIMQDYLPAQEESMMNCVYWIHSLPEIYKKILIFPFKVINHFLSLRNRLNRRMGMHKVKGYYYEDCD